MADHGYRVYVIQLEDPLMRGMRLCIAVARHWESRNPRLHIPHGDVYYADGCQAQGYRFAVLRNVEIPNIRGYRGRTHVGNVQPHQLAQFENALATTSLRDGHSWAFYALRRLNAHRFEVPIYDPEPVWKGLAEGRRRWERGEA